MAAVRFKAKVDAQGNVTLPVAQLAPGTEVEVDALLHPVGTDFSLHLLSKGEELETEVLACQDPLNAEDNLELEILRRMAMSNLDFWDNEVDNASGITPRLRDVFLAPFRFADLEFAKSRPVLILSGSIYNSRNLDVIVIPITSKLDGVLPGITITSDQFENGGLATASRVLPTRITTISKALLETYKGRVRVDVLKQAIEQLLEH